MIDLDLSEINKRSSPAAKRPLQGGGVTVSQRSEACGAGTLCFLTCLSLPRDGPCKPCGSVPGTRGGRVSARLCGGRAPRPPLRWRAVPQHPTCRPHTAHTLFPRLLAQLNETEAAFDEFWAKHQQKLEQCLQLRHFEQDFREVSGSERIDGHLSPATSGLTKP